MSNHVEQQAVPNPASTNWVPVGPGPMLFSAGYEIGYDQITADVPVTSTSLTTPTTVIPGSAHTYDGNPVLFEFQAPYVIPDSVAGNLLYFGLCEGSTWINYIAIATSPNAAQNFIPMRGSIRLTPSAGSHTYSVKAYASAGTTAKVAGGVPLSGNWSPTYLRATTVNLYAGPPPALAYGTTLPTATTDGMEAILVDSVTNPSYQWRFRYNAGSSSAYKWEFVGGSRWMGSDDADVSTSVGFGAPVALGTLPTFVAPRSGDYEVGFNTNYYNTAANVYGYGIPTLGGVAQGIYAFFAAQGAFWTGPGRRTLRLNGVGSGGGIQLMHATDGGVAHFRQRDLTVQPIRVS